jgi:predicted PurR-regulated permease PerM
MTEFDQNNQRVSNAGRGLLIFAALIVILAGLKSAQTIVVPMLLAVFIATIAASPLFWCKSKGMSNGLALTSVVLGIFLALGLIAALLTQSTSEFSAKLPFYQERLSNLQNEALVLLQTWDIPLDPALLADAFPLGSLLTLAGSALRSLGSVLSNGFLIILTVIFILAEATSFYPKLRAVLTHPERDLAHFGRVTGTMNRYIAIKTSVSLFTGVMVTAFLWALDVDFPVLWGLVALLLNFIPTIGSIIAGIPPVLLALVQLGPAEAGLVVLGFFLVNTIVGNILEPRYMGKGLGLSALVVFVSLIFWGWLLGPVGMLLSVPLTMSAKIALEANPNTAWIARLLAPAQELAGLSPDAEPIQEKTNNPDAGTSPSNAKDGAPV